MKNPGAAARSARLASDRRGYKPGAAVRLPCYDILGVYWLAESLLVGELEANWVTTFGAMGSRGLVALRDGYQARFALGVAFLGFFLQFLSDVV